MALGLCRSGLARTRLVRALAAGSRSHGEASRTAGEPRKRPEGLVIAA